MKVNDNYSYNQRKMIKLMRSRKPFHVLSKLKSDHKVTKLAIPSLVIHFLGTKLGVAKTHQLMESDEDTLNKSTATGKPFLMP